MRKSPTKTNEILLLKEKPFIELDRKRFYFHFALQSSEIPYSRSYMYVCTRMRDAISVEQLCRKLEGEAKKRRARNRQERKRKRIIGILESGMRAEIVMQLKDSGRMRERRQGRKEKVSFRHYKTRNKRKREKECVCVYRLCAFDPLQCCSL